jgi:cell wall-associated NlpC family hydrolase
VPHSPFPASSTPNQSGVEVLNNLKKISYLFASLLLLMFIAGATTTSAQDRPRVVRSISSQPLNQPPSISQEPANKVQTLSSSSPTNSAVPRPTLTNNITVAPESQRSLVKKTVSSVARNAASLTAGKMIYSSLISAGLMRGIQARMGIPYLYGSSGPNRYDCSGFVWAVFNEAGIPFTRQSARSLWAMSEPVTGDDRFKFGTLVFLNGLGHMGIVADEEGFYHASSSKGITYSKFAGYWENRIVGFRRLPLVMPNVTKTSEELADK